jgi:hypothetical protein
MTKQQLATVKRVATLEKAIIAALKKHKANLEQGGYMDAIGTEDACVCAIGAAILSKAPDTETAELYECKLEKLRDNDEDLHAWAAKLVNNGITASDLAQLELGFEGWYISERDQETKANTNSPYWDLGVKLGYKACSYDKEELKSFELEIAAIKVKAYRDALCKAAKIDPTTIALQDEL